MADTYDQIELERNGMKVILKFPKKTEHEEVIRREIKDMLACALREQIESTAYRRKEQAI